MKQQIAAFSRIKTRKDFNKPWDIMIEKVMKWGPILFTDKYQVRRFGNTHHQFVWRLLGERLKSQGVPATMKHKGSSLTIWRFFGRNDTLRILREWWKRASLKMLGKALKWEGPHFIAEQWSQTFVDLATLHWGSGKNINTWRRVPGSSQSFKIIQVSL